jgi:hypothetical protein
MKLIAIFTAALTAFLIAVSTVWAGGSGGPNTSSAEGTVQAMYRQIGARNAAGALQYVSKASNIDQQAFDRDVFGKDGSLRTLSSLQGVQTRVLHENDTDALVRTTATWSTAVGALTDTRDLTLTKESGAWKVNWPAEKMPNLPPQVIPVNYLRWDVIHRGSDEDWGAQDVAAPNVRIISMNAVEQPLGNGQRGVIIMGEIVNQDTVPAFATVNATLIGQNGNQIAQETSFDKMSHTLLPKEVSPYRIDFPNIKLAQVKSLSMQPNALLVSASADPVIAVLHQRIETDSRGRKVLRGELLNESGQTVNIPHVLATYYDDAGRVVAVNDGYVDHALQPQIPVPFQLEVRDDVASGKYRVTVNQYSIDRQGS